MKIAFILSSISNHGPSIIAQSIINNLSYEVLNHLEVFYLKSSADTLEFNCNTTKVSFFTKIDLLQFDVVHSHGFLADMFVSYNRTKFKGKWITTMHQNIFPDYSMRYNVVTGFILERIWCWGANRSNCVVCLTQDMVDYYKKKIRQPKLTYIFNGTTRLDPESLILEEDLVKLNLLKEKHQILGVSARLLFRKGIDQIINFLSLDIERKTALVILGDGAEWNRLKKLSIDLNVQDRCLFLGYRRSAIDYYKYFDLYIMSSRSEAFGLCVIEAASQKIPVVCSNLNVYNQLFFNDEVVKFKLEDVNSLHDSIFFAIRNKTVLSEKIYNAYLNRFTAETMARKYFETYNLLIKNDVM